MESMDQNVFQIRSEVSIPKPVVKFQNAKTLGILQIVTGIVILFCGFLFFITISDVESLSKQIVTVVICGHILFVSTGAVSVGAAKKLRVDSIKWALYVNTASIVFSGLGICYFIMLCSPMIFNVVSPVQLLPCALLLCCVVQLLLSIFIAMLAHKASHDEQTELSISTHHRP